MYYLKKVHVKIDAQKQKKKKKLLLFSAFDATLVMPKSCQSRELEQIQG